jgi:hypothetical protein
MSQKKIFYYEKHDVISRVCFEMIIDKKPPVLFMQDLRGINW